MALKALLLGPLFFYILHHLFATESALENSAVGGNQHDVGDRVHAVDSCAVFLSIGGNDQLWVFNAVVLNGLLEGV